MQEVFDKIDTLQKSFSNQSLDYQQKQKEQEKSYKDLLTSIDNFKNLFKKEKIPEPKDELPDLSSIENSKNPTENNSK
jgi:hypothetical protein